MFGINIFQITNKLVVVINGIINSSITSFHEPDCKLCTTDSLLNDAMEGRNIFSELNTHLKPVFSCITGVPSVKVKSAFPFLVQTSQISS